MYKLISKNDQIQIVKYPKEHFGYMSYSDSIPTEQITSSSGCSCGCGCPYCGYRKHHSHILFILIILLVLAISYFMYKKYSQ